MQRRNATGPAMQVFRSLQQIFEPVFGGLPAPVFLFDANAGLVKANRAFCALAGVPEADVTAYDVSSFFAVLRTYRFPVPDRYVTELTTLSGEVVPVEFNYTKFEGADNATRGGIAFLKDLRDTRMLQDRINQISIEKESLKKQLDGAVPDEGVRERTRLEHQINAEKNFLENVIESCGDAIVIFDGKGAITRVNDSFANVAGKQKQELIGTTLVDLGPNTGTFTSSTGETVVLDDTYLDYTYRQVETFIQLPSGGKLENWEYYMFNSRGEIVPMDATATVQKNEAGVITGSVCVLRDVTERKKAERALQEAYQFRNRFFANITHEFRTPLTLTIGPLEEVLRGESRLLSPPTADRLGLALRNARRLLKLINQLLDFSLLESGVQNVFYEKRDINKFVAAILDAFTLIAKQKKISLAFAPCEALQRTAIDPGKMERVLFNLIGNAFKFTPEKGGVTVSVAQAGGVDSIAEQNTFSAGIDPQAMGRCIKISVRDTGAGIAREHLPKIFERFDRGGLEAGRGQSGAGIGLAYARELVDAVGGCITVDSGSGRGTTFALYLPLDAAPTLPDVPAVQDAEELILQPSVELSDVYRDSKTTEQQVSGTKALVLIVDDNPDVRKYITGIIAAEYDFVAAADGRQALARIRKFSPDIILCDVMMPGMDGYEVLRRVKKKPATRIIPFIFLTARADTRMMVEGLEEGADDYIVKPFNALELLARLKAQLRIRDLMRTAGEQQRTISQLTQKLHEKYRFGNIVGSSPSMRKIYQLIETIRESDASVLITGETGTGKELVANAIHYNSLRKNGPMVSVNCGAIPRELMERELFGHVKGAYTGAVESRKGYFEEANRGTLFLDEIGEMDRDMQVKLLRVLERGEVTRVGDTTARKVDVRLVLATNKNLYAEVQKGTFREDLYYRVHVIPIHLPPLRHRRDDIPLLIEHFMSDFARRQGTTPEPIPEKEIARFLSYGYPGNVRELRHMVERYCLLGDTEALFDLPVVDSVPQNGDLVYSELLEQPNPLKAASRQGKTRSERAVIMHVLKLCGGDYIETARRLKISRSSIYEKLKAYGLK